MSMLGEEEVEQVGRLPKTRPRYLAFGLAIYCIGSLPANVV